MPIASLLYTDEYDRDDSGGFKRVLVTPVPVPVVTLQPAESKVALSVIPSPVGAAFPLPPKFRIPLRFQLH